MSRLDECIYVQSDGLLQLYVVELSTKHLLGVKELAWNRHITLD